MGKNVMVIDPETHWEKIEEAIKNRLDGGGNA